MNDVALSTTAPPPLALQEQHAALQIPQIPHRGGGGTCGNASACFPLQQTGTDSD